MDGHIWFVGWYDGGDYHEIKITQKEVEYWQARPGAV